MSFIQELQAEVKKFMEEADRAFNNLGGEVEALKAKLQSHVDTLKNKVDYHCRSHTAQTLSDAGKVIPHDAGPQAQSEANPAPAAPVTVVGSADAVAAAKAEDPSLQTVAEVKAQADAGNADLEQSEETVNTGDNTPSA